MQPCRQTLPSCLRVFVYVFFLLYRGSVSTGIYGIFCCWKAVYCCFDMASSRFTFTFTSYWRIWNLVNQYKYNFVNLYKANLQSHGTVYKLLCIHKLRTTWVYLRRQCMCFRVQTSKTRIHTMMESICERSPHQDTEITKVIGVALTF